MDETKIIRTPEQAGEYVRTLQAVLRSVGASDGSMEQVSIKIGNIRGSDDF